MDAVDAFARTGNRPALFRGLLAVGVSGAAARWHLENVGRCFAVVLLKGLRQKPLRRILSYPAQRFEGVVQGSPPLGQACARSTMPQPPTDY
ncbi:MAG: hypothetical protein WB820_16475 [Rhodoplanes sp.]